MVTHSWENLFRDLCAAVIADALEENTFDLKLDPIGWNQCNLTFDSCV